MFSPHFEPVDAVRGANLMMDLSAATERPGDGHGTAQQPDDTRVTMADPGHVHWSRAQTSDSLDWVRALVPPWQLLLASALVSVLVSSMTYAHAGFSAQAAPPASENGTWIRGAPMPSERGEVGAAALDGRIYVVGAYSGATDANEAYDPVTDSWQTLASLPRPLNHVCAVGVGARLYVIGGFDPAARNRPVDLTYVFDPATNTWNALAPMPTPRGALACVAVDQMIYAIGGATPTGDMRTTEAYDPTTDTWRTDLASMPTPREHIASATLDGLDHVIGGRSPSIGIDGTTHEVYDPARDGWTAAAPLPTGRSGIGAAVLAGRIHVLGGEADHTFEQNEAYDAATDTWLTFAPLRTPRHGLGVVTVGEAIYILAGGRQPGDTRSNIVEIFRLS